jgi:hypothetical protein
MPSLKQNQLFVAAVKGWLPLAFAITVMAGLVYGAVQQDLRQTANDPQVQIAEDTARALSNNQSPNSVLLSPPIDMGKSLAPFMIIYSQDKHVLASSGELDGGTPKLPDGVLEHAAEVGEARQTWQPKEGVRLATVIKRYDSGQPGFVLVGRSLREVERRYDQLLAMVGLTWLIALGGSLTLATITTKSRS